MSGMEIRARREILGWAVIDFSEICGTILGKTTLLLTRTPRCVTLLCEVQCSCGAGLHLLHWRM